MVIYISQLLNVRELDAVSCPCAPKPGGYELPVCFRGRCRITASAPSSSNLMNPTARHVTTEFVCDMASFPMIIEADIYYVLEIKSKLNCHGVNATQCQCS